MLSNVDFCQIATLNSIHRFRCHLFLLEAKSLVPRLKYLQDSNETGNNVKITDIDPKWKGYILVKIVIQELG